MPCNASDRLDISQEVITTNYQSHHSYDNDNNDCTVCEIIAC